MDRRPPNAAPESQDGTEPIDVDSLDVPTSLGLVVRAYLKNLRPMPEPSGLALNRSESSAAQCALLAVGEGSASPANGN